MIVGIEHGMGPSMNTTATGAPAGGGIDVDALRAKYEAERDKRLQPDGEEQFLTTTGQYARYFEEDRYVAPGYTRDPVSLAPDVVVIGGGFAGLISAARLMEAGFRDLHVIEAGGDFGGTWYWNRYPGSQCDVESYCYLPLLEETGFMPKEKYSYAPEIFEYCQLLGRRFGLYERTLFQTRVDALDWDEHDKRWRVTTSRGDDIRARFVVSASGPASSPRLPGVPGIEDFAGHSFHTSRWDYDYTGGDHGGNLTKLADKRVAVIGTGATAIQCVPHLGAAAEHLYVFQRTPSSVDIRGNKPTDPEWVESLKPGWQKERQENFNDVVIGRPFEEDLVNDSWTYLFRNLQNAMIRTEAPETGMTFEDFQLMAEVADFENMNRIRTRVDDHVDDPETAEALKPWYRQFCKRPCFNDEYLPTFNRPNVTLVDTSGSGGVERITPAGVVANGREHAVDCIIFATGFEISSGFKRRIRYEVNGAGGRSIYDYWKDGRRTFHGHSSHGFPNWFFIGNSQVGVSVNYSSMVDEQARNVAYVMHQAQARGALAVQPTAEAEAAWVNEIRALALNVVDFFDACTPGYYNNEGKFREATATLAGDAYTPGANAFNALLAEWREAGTCKGLQFDDGAEAAGAPSP